MKVDPPIQIAFAPDVRLHPLHLEPKSMDFLRVAAATAPKLYSNVLWVSSAFDGDHGIESFHWVGAAWDLRFLADGLGNAREGMIVIPLYPNEPIGSMHERQRDFARAWTARMDFCLRGRWQIVVESNHIHGERDPG